VNRQQRRHPPRRPPAVSPLHPTVRPLPVGHVVVELFPAGDGGLVAEVCWDVPEDLEAPMVMALADAVEAFAHIDLGEAS
jgi:hypothetical protein